MAYTAVPTAYTGAPGWTATWVNKYLKDNFAASVPDIFTAKGDLAIASAADTAIAFPVGADGTNLWADSTATYGVVWGGAGLTKVNDPDTSLNHAQYGTAYQVVNLDNEYYDLTGVWASDTFTAPHDGYYLVTAMFQAGTVIGDFDAGDLFHIMIYKSDQLYSVIAGTVWVAASGTSIITANGSDIVYLARTNTLKFYVQINGGAACTWEDNPNAEDVSHHISVTWLM